MGEKEIEVVKVRMFCDKCESGEMIPTGEEIEAIPLQFPHKCNNCKIYKTFWDIYPLTREKEK